MSDLTPLEWPGGVATVADAERTLEAIDAAETWEQVWERARDPDRLYHAIDVKLRCQIAYAVWRQDHASRGGEQSRGTATLPDNDPGKQMIHRWRAKLCRKVDKHTWAEDQAKLAAALEDAKERCRRIVEQENLGTIRGTEGTGEFERYTPGEFVDYARVVMGGIDLDPASSDYAQQTVRAEAYFTVADDGLTRDWRGTVWLNPPYHRELAPMFVKKLIGELRAGRVTQAIMLVNNVTDTTWFQEAAEFCAALCFTAGRIRFEVPDDDPVLPTQGQTFFYFGPNVRRFVEVFDTVGFCVLPTAPVDQSEA